MTTITKEQKLIRDQQAKIAALEAQIAPKAGPSLDEHALDAGVAVRNGAVTVVKTGASIIGGAISGLFNFGKGIVVGDPQVKA